MIAHCAGITWIYEDMTTRPSPSYYGGLAAEWWWFCKWSCGDSRVADSALDEDTQICSNLSNPGSGETRASGTSWMDRIYCRNVQDTVVYFFLKSHSVRYYRDDWYL